MIAPRYLTTTFIALASAAVLQACGGGKEANTSANNASTTTPPAGSTAATTAAANSASTAGTATLLPPTGTTTKVQMTGDAKGYREVPMNLTIKVGDAVQWTNVSGGPHNVSFWPDSIPAGSEAQLSANMPAQTSTGPAQKLGGTVGPLLTAPNDTYTISFAGVKPGVYKYYCTPHLALGMKGTITVQ